MLNILDEMLSKTERLISCFLKQNVLNVITNIFVRLSWSYNTVVSRAKGLKSGDNACNLFSYLSDCPRSCCVVCQLLSHVQLFAIPGFFVNGISQARILE